MIRSIARVQIVFRRLRRRMQHYDALRVWITALFIGIAAAYGVIAFLFLIDFVSTLAFGATEEDMTTGAKELPFLRAWIAPVIGGFVVGGILYVSKRFGWLENGRGQGIAEVIEARAVGTARIDMKTGLAAAIVSAVSLGSGASAGREGPAVHLGATIASGLERFTGFSAKQRRALLGCGAAAAVSASFNAPIAGVLFALEVILGNYALSFFGPIVASSVVAAIVTRIHLGDFPAFAPPEYGAIATIDVPLAALLGLICGAITSIFLLSTEHFTVRVRKLAARRNISLFFLPPIGGVLIGLIGALYPEIFGVGYEAVTKALAGEYTILALFVLIVMKCAATAITLSCRFGGGVFAPGLVVGAFVGAAFGASLGVIMPDAAASPVFYAMIGMGAMSGAILGAPISTTLIIFELTGEYGITISLMVAVAIATLITQWVCGRSFFHWQLSRKGYDLSEGPQGVILQTIRVRDVMEKMPSTSTLSEDALG